MPQKRLPVGGYDENSSVVLSGRTISGQMPHLNYDDAGQRKNGADSHGQSFYLSAQLSFVPKKRILD